MKLVSLLLLIFYAKFALSQENGNVGELGEDKIPEKVEKTKSDEELDELEKTKFHLLGRLDPFENIIVLQRRLLPKQYRFEGSVALGLLADNPFFVTNTAYMKLGYFFNEAFGAEINTFFASTSNSSVTQDLLDNEGVQSTTTAIPSNYFGIDLKWNPIYGKIALWGESIVPFDNYYFAGIGQTSIKNGGGAATIHFGSGLTFAHNKWLATRFEIGFYSYEVSGAGSFLDTHISIGLSAFFPEAKYR